MGYEWIYEKFCIGWAEGFKAVLISQRGMHDQMNLFSWAISSRNWNYSWGSSWSKLIRGLWFHPTLRPTAIDDKSARGSDDDAVTLERPMNYGT